MKVINPTVTNHTLVIIPRVYPSLALTLELYEEATQIITNLSVTYNVVDGKLNLNFTYTFVDKQKFSFKITEDSEVIYRDKIWVTTQTPQDFKLTEGVYIYG
jgi:hypothetical protein